MSNLPFLILVFVLISITHVAKAQDHDHEGSHMHEKFAHKYEFGVALGPVYGIAEDVFTASLHLHMIRNFGHDSRYGAGLGFETIFDEHHHLNFSLPVNYNTGRGFVFTLSPGLLLKKETAWDSKPSIHLEILYEFMYEHFHLGPIFEMTLVPSDTHIMIGMHFAIGLGNQYQ